MEVSDYLDVLPCRAKWPMGSILCKDSLIGIELEIEFDCEVSWSSCYERYFHPTPRFQRYWTLHGEDSLVNGTELVLSHPLAGRDLEDALSVLEVGLLGASEHLRMSDRTSLHVHMDVRDLSGNQFISMMYLYALLESGLYGMSGNRVDNRYCLPMCICPDQLSEAARLIDDLKEGGCRYRRPLQNLKYSGFNTGRLSDLGTVEFRMHEGTHDTRAITKWINTLLAIKSEVFNNTITSEDVESKGVSCITNPLLLEVVDHLSPDNQHLFNNFLSYVKGEVVCAV